MSTNTSQLDEEGLSQLLILQADRMKTLKNTLNNFRMDSGKTNVRKTKSYYDTRLRKIDTAYKEFQEDHKLLLFSLDSKEDYFQNDSASQFEEAYLEVYCAIVDDRENVLGVAATSEASSNQNSAQNNTVNQHQLQLLSSVQVPNIPIVSFSGHMVDWLPFYDSFVRLVHANLQLNPIQKFHILKQSLPKDKDVDIHHMTLTEDNYNSAWNLLVKRYENPRVQFMTLMNSLYGIQQQEKESSEQLKSLLNAANVFINGLKRWDVPIDTCDHWLVHYLSTKLSTTTHKAWENHLGNSTEIPTFKKFEEFLNGHIITLDAIENRNIGNPTHRTNKEQCKPNNSNSNNMNDKRFSNKSYKNDKKSFHALTKNSGSKGADACIECGFISHSLSSCKKFRDKDCFARKSVAEKEKLCFNCLGKSHSVSQCTSKRNCNICGHRHHTLLHFPVSSTAAQTNTTSSSQLNTVPSVQPSLVNSVAHSSNPQQSITSHVNRITSMAALKPPPSVLLSTLLVKLVHPVTGREMMVRAFFDGGSEGTAVSERLVQSMGLTRYPIRTDISGVGDSKQFSSEAVGFTLRSFINPDFSLAVDMALVLPTVTAHLPTKRIVPQAWAHIQGLELADPTYFQPGKIDLLIGSELSAAILLPNQKMGSPSEPIAQNSHFGWMLSGPAGSASPTHHIRCHHTRIETNALESLVRGFFDSEQLQEERSLSEEERWVVDFFERTHIRKEDGKYQVRLPLKSIFDPTQTLGKSQQMALNRFHQLDRKLHRNAELHKRYSDGIQEYFDLNQIKRAFSTEQQHCTVASTNLPTVTASVLPHHAIIKEDSITTKCRIVFDASAKTSNGRSLNDLLCIGPPLQNDLGGVIINWRLHKYVFTTDIQKMYRCIDMHPEDAQYQRIWWYDENGAPQLFILTTVTFGTASAPCTAILVMHQIAENEKETFPLAESVLRHEIYVDDIQTGSHTIDKTLEIRNHLIGALKSAGMELRKWASNDHRILEGIPPEHQSNSQSLALHNQDTIKILGMCWIPNNDNFKFQLKFELPTEITKRSILSTIARLYDPLGYIAPVIIAAKIILKEAWAANTGWDQPLPSNVIHNWRQFASSLPSINQIVVPRWINYEPGTVNSIQLQVFCDGSTSAYAAAAYIRIQYNTGEVHTHLIASKSKVTPTKPLTIPKIELNGAELAVRLAGWVTKQLRIKIDSIHFWSDATVVLYWIHGDINRWKTFVANRILKILNASQPNQWNHVSTKENPADCATRGLTPHQLKSFDLWWKGPLWLSQTDSHWPKFDFNTTTIEESSAEIKTAKVHMHFNIPCESIIFKYSSYHRLIRVNAWIWRFKGNCLSKRRLTSKHTGPLLVSELHQSLLRIVRLVQQESFGTEIALISSNEQLPTKCKIRGLAPFIDNKNNLLRVRGRLQRSSLSYQQKHPIILPSSHYFTKLVIDDSHIRTLHGGATLVLSHTRQQFWIVDGRRTVQLQLRKCVQCFKCKPESSSQLMGNLPYHRVNPPQRAFAATGVDYTGAFEVKASRFRGNTTYKAYVVIFICLATKAVHLEAVTGMTTKHFLWAFQRFIGRRGICHDIYSDNGTNFIGADKKLKENVPFVTGVENDVIPELSKQGIQWHFNPPHSPNFGGLWEANIRSLKHHLYRVLDNSHLTYEELSTILVRIESVLNSRPLCPLTTDPDDLNILTPGHFLIGAPLLSLPEKPDLAFALCDNYVAMQQMMQQFWQRWSSDWLSHLQNRPKWHKIQPNLQVNDIVIIKDDRLKPSEWLIGRIIEIHPGADNLVRVATVRTQKGIYKRSVSKLCRLPIPNELTNSSSNNNSSSSNVNSIENVNHQSDSL